VQPSRTTPGVLLSCCCSMSNNYYPSMPTLPCNLFKSYQTFITPDWCCSCWHVCVVGCCVLVRWYKIHLQLTLYKSFVHNTIRPVATFRHEEAFASSFKLSETQINVTRNCVKRKKIWQKESYKPVAVVVRLRSTPYVVTSNIFVFCCSWQSYLHTYLLT